MTETTLFPLLLAILVLEYLIDLILDYLNARKFTAPPPAELSDLYSEEEYERAQRYKSVNYRFGLVSSTFSMLLLLGFLLFGGFEWMDTLVRQWSPDPMLQLFFFFGLLYFGNDLLSLPLKIYGTFGIEARFGFNRTTPGLFLADLLKGWVLAALIGALFLGAIYWFYTWAGPSFWLYAWAMITAISVLANLFYSRLIVPLFNRQRPLEDGSLRKRIEEYAEGVGFGLKQIFVIDGSKRSTKANAYFSGFGSQKRIALFDTLLEDLEENEVVAVLAHEVGHYKRNHIIINLIVSVILTGITLLVLSLFLNRPELAGALGVSQVSFHASLLAFGLLYSPISTLTSLFGNFLSRKFEFQADDYARETYGGEPLVSSLKKLSRNHLSNLTPHPAYVFTHYSHPPLIQRIRNLSK